MAATLLHEEGANLDLQRHHINQVLSLHVIDTSDRTLKTEMQAGTLQ